MVIRLGIAKMGARMGRRGRQLTKKHDDPVREAVISEWDRWASRRLPTGYKATDDDEMSFFGHMQKDCPYLLPDGMGDPWQAVHGWLLLERRVRDQVGATGTTRRRRQYFTGPLVIIPSSTMRDVKAEARVEEQCS